MVAKAERRNTLEETQKNMAILAVLGGLLGGAAVLAVLRSKRNSAKSTHVQSVNLR